MSFGAMTVENNFSRISGALLRWEGLLGRANLLRATSFMVSVFIGAAAYAAESPFHDKPASAQSLPGDNLPPFRMLANGRLTPIPDLPPGVTHRGAGSPPESSAPGPSLESAVTAAREGVKLVQLPATELGLRLSIQLVKRGPC